MRPQPGDHAVAGDLLVGHAEVGGPVLDEHVELFEGAFVEQQVDALAGGQLTLGVLAGDPLLAAAHPRLGAPLVEFLKDMLHANGPSRCRGKG